MTDPDYEALRDDVGAVWLARDAVQAAGPDTWDFLQGQLSQDLGDMAAGQARESLLLQPQGKVEAYVRVLRTGADEAVIDVDAGWGEAVLSRLSRFKLRTRCELEAIPWRCLALRGPRAHEVAAGDGTAHQTHAIVADWPAWPGVDLAGPDSQPPEGVRLCSTEAYEALRIEAGVPRMGAELTERTIPAEAGPTFVARTVSFTKGCFTGQELVARIDSRGGNVPRQLRGVVAACDPGNLPPLGARVVAGGDGGGGGKAVGELTSVAWSPGRRSAVALAFLGRAVEPPAEVTVTWEGGPALVAQAEHLPLLP